MSLKKTSLVTMKIAASLVSISLLANCGSDQQFGADDGATTLKSSSGSQDLASRDQMGVTPVVDENGNLKDPRGDKEKDCNGPRTTPTPKPAQPQPPRDPQKDQQPSRGEVCAKYPLYPAPLRAEPNANPALGSTIHAKPAPRMIEAYRFEMYNASNLTHGWVPASNGLKLDRYSAVMTVDVDASSSNPVVLALHSYEPTIWKINDPARRVLFVDVSGYHCQSVEGASQAKVLIRAVGSGPSIDQRPSDGVLIKSQKVYEGASINFVFKAGL